MNRNRAAQHVLKALKKKYVFYASSSVLVRLMHWWGRLRTFGPEWNSTVHANGGLSENCPRHWSSRTNPLCTLRYYAWWYAQKKPLKSAKGKLRWVQTHLRTARRLKPSGKSNPLSLRRRLFMAQTARKLSRKGIFQERLNNFLKAHL